MEENMIAKNEPFGDLKQVHFGEDTVNILILPEVNVIKIPEEYII